MGGNPKEFIFLRVELVQRAIDFRQLGIVLPQFRRALFDNFMQPPVLLRQPTRAPADQRPDDSSQKQQLQPVGPPGAIPGGEHRQPVARQFVGGPVQIAGFHPEHVFAFRQIGFALLKCE